MIMNINKQAEKDEAQRNKNKYNKVLLEIKELQSSIVGYAQDYPEDYSNFTLWDDLVLTKAYWCYEKYEKGTQKNLLRNPRAWYDVLPSFIRSNLGYIKMVVGTWFYRD